uniref:Uncharacterized protein n=1 Tax=Amphora coffeiformis TaxID=265554 RepID=A0A7S3L4N9_9STRA
MRQTSRHKKFIRKDRFFAGLGAAIYILVQVFTHSRGQLSSFQESTSLLQKTLFWQYNQPSGGRRLGSDMYMTTTTGDAITDRPPFVSQDKSPPQLSVSLQLGEASTGKKRMTARGPSSTERKNRVRVAREEVEQRRRANMRKRTIVQQDESRHPIFYNLYVQPDNYKNSMLIAQEQMQQREMLATNATLFYTLIGSPKVTTEFCEPNCHQREYLEQGQEVDTHQAIWEYCQDRPDEWVTYLHDKGSLHDNENNRRARRIATRAALACRKLILNRSPTSFNWNICGAGFNVLPQFQGNANMWAAKCSYMHNLYEPRKYSRALEEMYNTTILDPTLGNTTYACLQPTEWRDSHTGLGRYAGERWAYSHPDVRPCSSLGGTTVSRAELDFVPRLRKEPNLRAKFGPLANHRYHNSFARLEGRLFEWKYLYGQAPPDDSWIWKYYIGYETGTEEFLQSCKALANATQIQ